MDIVRIGHDTLLDEHRRVQEAVLGINKFQAIPTPKDAKVVFQYDIANQQYYQIHEVVLISATSTFQQVVNSYKNELFKLEMQVPTDFEVENTTDAGIESSKNEKKGFAERLGLGGGKKKRIITNNDPYQHGLPYLTESLSKIERLERFGEMQSYGVDLSEYASVKGMLAYLQFHRTRFKFEIAPTILRMHKQYVDLVLKQEKMGAIQIATKLDDEIFKTRNDMPMG